MSARRAPYRAVMVAAVLSVIAGTVALHRSSPPTAAQVRANYRPSEAYLLDRHGQVLDTRRVNLGVRRFGWTPLREISPALVAAVIEGEDHRFWQHHGVDWAGVAGAFRDGLVRHRHRGASTITMQLVSLLDAPERPQGTPHSIVQKLRQMWLAYALEAHWTKLDILEAHLNLLQYRGELQGIAAASAVLAHKSPSGLSAAESYVLAALLPNPGSSAEHVGQRACARLARAPRNATCAMVTAAATTLLAKDTDTPGADHLAPQLAAELLRAPDTQRLARDALAHQLAGLRARNVRDGAAIVVDNVSGDILAYVGSAGPASRAAQVDGVRARRQAGSTLKPFLYELALERRYVTASSLLDDSPLNLDTDTGTYIPQDYDHEFKGLVSLRTALGASLNVPAVRTLVLVGVESFRDRLHALGYTGITQDGQYYGYSLALGSAEVSLWEQAQAYLSLARAGRLKPLRLLAQSPPSIEETLLSPSGTFIVDDMLSDPSARVLTFGLDSALNTGYWSAVKTGTSKDMRDNWCVGFSSRYTVAVWVGNFEGDPMHDVSGVTGAAPVWREIMDSLHSHSSSGPMARPASVTAQQIQFPGGIETPRREYFIKGTGPSGAFRGSAHSAQIPHVSSPANGLVIALDPDIPPQRQRVLISAQGGSRELVWRINGTVVGRAGQPLLWVPTAGVHRLALEQPSGEVLDRVLFTVR